MQANAAGVRPAACTMREAIGEEYKEFIKYLGKVEQDSNPMDWWRTREKDFPKLSLYWKAHSSYPATSASAERSFNIDGLIFTPLSTELTER